MQATYQQLSTVTVRGLAFCGKNKDLTLKRALYLEQSPYR